MEKTKHHFNQVQTDVIDFVKSKKDDAALKEFFIKQNEKLKLVPNKNSFRTDLSRLFRLDSWITKPKAKIFKVLCEQYTSSLEQRVSGTIFYFESSNGGIGKAKIKWDDGGDFQSANLTYLDESNAEKHSFKMELQRTSEELPYNTMYYKATCEEPDFIDQMNFFTVKSKFKSLNTISSIFISYSVLVTENKILSTGIGLWYNSQNLDEDVKKPAPGWVSYALLNCRVSISDKDWKHDFIKRRVKHDFFKDAPSGFSTYNALSLKFVHNEYYLLYITKTIEDKDGNRGGLGLAKLYVQESKHCSLEYYGHDGIMKYYKGTIMSGDNNADKLQILMEKDKHNNYNRQVFIKKDQTKFYGIYILWVDNAPIMTPCLIIPVTENLEIKRYSFEDIRNNSTLQSSLNYLKEKVAEMDRGSILFSKDSQR